MIDILEKKVFYAIGLLGLATVSVGAYSIDPNLTLNDFPPEEPIGRYIEEVSSNVVETVVVLSNGVLTVAGESINVAEPTKTVITNGVTNVYHAVYEDDLKDYATIRKMTVTTNGVGQVVTNWTAVAYLDDIPQDSKKADKVIRLWDYNCTTLGVTLQRTMDKDAPFAAWGWDGSVTYAGNTYTNLLLTFTNGIWNCRINNTSPPLSIDSAEEDADTLVFGPSPELTFQSTNNTQYAFVVYDDQMTKAIKEELYGYVAKTNLYGISGRIVDEKLTTIGGIIDILKGIRSELNNIAGGVGIRMTFRNVANSRIVLGPVETLAPGDSVDIDWGDGSGQQTTTLPAEHDYDGSHTNVEVIITGFIKTIKGTTNMPFASVSNAVDGLVFNRLVGMRTDVATGLTHIGDYAFYGCTGLIGDLTFLPRGTVALGKSSFEGSGITSLAGLPLSITKIPERCFVGTMIPNLAGLSPGVEEIGDYAFAECTMLSSLSGIPQGLVNLGRFSFSGCSFLTSMDGLSICTNIVTIPEGCFYGAHLDSLASLPERIVSLGSSAFASDETLTTVDGSLREWESIGSNAFENAYSLSSVNLPANITSMGRDAFVNVATLVPSIEVTFLGKTIAQIEDIPEPGMSASKAFPWGLPLAAEKTRIVCLDGELVSNGTGWTTNSSVIAFAMRNMETDPEGITVRIGEVDAEPMAARGLQSRRDVAGGFLVDWGDGTPIDSSTSHNYRNVSNADIRIIGRIRSLGGQDGGRPFITVGTGNTTTNLTEVDVGGLVGLTSIGSNAFNSCTSLIKVGGVAEDLVVLGENCFLGCSSLTNIDFIAGTGLTSLPNGCFDGCTGLDSISSLQSSAISRIGARCFYGCRKLGTTEGLPTILTEMGESAFAGCVGISNIVLPSELTSIPSNGFRGCTNLSELVGSIASVTSVGAGAFSECIGITNVVIRRPIEVGVNAFQNIGNSNDNVEYVDEDGFKYKVLISFPDNTYETAADVLGLEDGSASDVSGLSKSITKVECDNGSLLYNQRTDAARSRWEILMPAMEFELRGVTNNTTFKVQTGGTTPYAEASLVWNWGDGKCERWIDGSPANHTYTNAGNYVVKVKGLLQSINSESRNSGAYIRLADGDGKTNPFLVGFSLPEDTPVKTVGKYTFSKCPNLKNINTRNLPRQKAPVKRLNRGKSLTRLQELSAATESHVVEYGEYCFAESGLENIAGLPSGTTTLTNGLFADTKNLSSLVGLPSGIVDIGDNAFMGSGVANLYGYPRLVKYISSYCFYGCTNLIDITDLQTTEIVEIEDYAFGACYELTSLYSLPTTLRMIGEGAFMGTGLTSLQHMPNTVTSLGPASFALCQNLKTIEGLSGGVSNLAAQTFMTCTSLWDVAISPSITNISDYCFADCEAITNLVATETLKSVGKMPFARSGVGVEPMPDLDGNLVSCTIRFPDRTCKEVRELLGDANLQSTLPNTKFIAKDGYIICEGGAWVDKIDTIRLAVTTLQENTDVGLGVIVAKQGYDYSVDWGDGSMDTNKSHVYQSPGEYEVVIKGKFMYIGSDSQDHAFVYNRNRNGPLILDSVEFGNNVEVEELGESTFMGCDSILDFSSLSNLLTVKIGANCFAGCTGMVNCDWVSSRLKEISTNSFAGCTMLANIDGLTNCTVEVLGKGAFAGCSGLTSISGLERAAITNIPEECFMDCSSIVSVNGLPDEVVEIGAKAFKGCTGLVDLTGIGNTKVVRIGDSAFEGCTMLKSFSGLSPYTSIIGDDCFRGCISLTNLDAMSLCNVTNIGSGCFAACTSLTSLWGFPKDVARVGEHMFEGCQALKDIITLPQTCTNFATSAFSGCTGLEDFVTLQSVERYDSSAFANCINVSNLVFTFTDFPYISDNVFSNLGTNVTQWNHQGDLVRTVVTMSQVSCEELKNKSGFPWGAPTEATKFICSDGYLVWLNGDWKEFYSTLEITMPVNPGEIYEIGQFSTADGSDYGIKILWGDGSSDIISPSGGTRHSYLVGGTVTMMLVGNIETIFSNGEYPFVRRIIGNVISPRRTPITAVSIPPVSSLTSIGSNAFIFCESLRTVNSRGAKMVEFGDGAFSGCTKLYNFTDCQNVTRYGNYAFKGCRSLDYSRLPTANVVEIGEGCFEDCTSLGFPYYMGTRINKATRWPKGVSVVSKEVFGGCNRLYNLTLSDSCIGIGQDALRGIGSAPDLPSQRDGYLNEYKSFVSILHTNCNDVMEGTFAKGGNESKEESFFPFGASTETKFICRDGYISYNPQKTKWEAHEYSISFLLDGIEIGDELTIAATKMQGSCKWIFGDGEEAQAFDNQPTTHTYQTTGKFILALDGSIADSLESQSSGTDGLPFLYVTRNDTILTNLVKTVVLGAKGGVTSIGARAFYGCSGLEVVQFDNLSLTNIGEYAFYGCSNLREIDLENTSVCAIGQQAFADCTMMNYFRAGERMVASEIGESAFLNIGKNVTGEKTNEYGQVYKVELELGKAYGKDIIQQSTNVFGIPNDGIVSTFDGYIGWDAANNKWRSYETTIIFAYDWRQESEGMKTVILGSFIPYPGSELSIDWGDGNGWCSMETNGTTHVYRGNAARGRVDIRVKGRIARISGQPTQQIMLTRHISSPERFFGGLLGIENYDTGKSEVITTAYVTDSVPEEDRKVIGEGALRVPPSWYMEGGGIGYGDSPPLHALRKRTTAKYIPLVQTEETVDPIKRYLNPVVSEIKYQKKIYTGQDFRRTKNGLPTDAVSSVMETLDWCKWQMTERLNSYLVKTNTDGYICVWMPGFYVTLMSDYLEDKFPDRGLRQSKSDVSIGWMCYADQYGEEAQQSIDNYVIGNPQNPGAYIYQGSSVNLRTKRDVIVDSYITLPNLSLVSCYKEDTDNCIYAQPAQGLVSVKIGNEIGLRDIGEFTFLANMNLSEIEGDLSNVTNIGRFAFSECTSFGQLPECMSLETIGDSTFKGCSTLTNLMGVGRCRQFGRNAFSGCSKLEGIDWLYENAVLGEGCFENCSGLKSIHGFPSGGVGVVPAYCFAECKGLKDVSGLPDGIKSIGQGAFMNSGVSDITDLGVGLEYIGTYAFYGCTITNEVITIPTNVSYLGARVLGHLPLETKVIYRPPELFEWDEQAFVSNYTNDYSGTFGAAYILASREKIEQALIRNPSYEQTVYKEKGYYRPVYGYGWELSTPDPITHDAYVGQKPAGLEFTLGNVKPQQNFFCGEFSTEVKNYDDYGYPMCIDWGDGNLDFFVGADLHSTNHTYVMGGDYKVNIMGSITRIRTESNRPVFWGDNSGETNIEKVVMFNFEDVNHSEGQSGPLFMDMRNCGRIDIQTAKTGDVPMLAKWDKDAFKNIGINLPERSIDGDYTGLDLLADARCRTFVNMESVQLDSLYTNIVDVSQIYLNPNLLFYAREGGVKYGRSNPPVWTKVPMYGFRATVESEMFDDGQEEKLPPAFIGPFTMVSRPKTLATYGDAADVTVVFNLSPKLMPVGIENGVKYYTWVDASEQGRSEIRYRNMTTHTATFFYVVVDNPDKALVLVGNERKGVLLPKSRGKLTDTKDGKKKYVWQIRVIADITSQNKLVENGRITQMEYLHLPNLTEIKTWENIDVKTLETIQFPPSIRYLGDGCFQNRNELRNLNWIPTNSLLSIGASCFAGCQDLTDIGGISNAVRLAIIGDRAFANCSSLQGIAIIPQNCVNIGKEAFLNAMGSYKKIEQVTTSVLDQGAWKGILLWALPSLEVQIMGASNYNALMRMRNFPWTTSEDMQGVGTMRQVARYWEYGVYVNHDNRPTYVDGVGRMSFKTRDDKIYSYVHWDNGLHWMWHKYPLEFAWP